MVQPWRANPFCHCIWLKGQGLGTVLRGNTSFKMEPSWALSNQGITRQEAWVYPTIVPKSETTLSGSCERWGAMHQQAETVQDVGGSESSVVVAQQSNTGVDSPQPKSADGSNSRTTVTSIYFSIAQELWDVVLLVSDQYTEDPGSTRIGPLAT